MLLRNRYNFYTKIKIVHTMYVVSCVIPQNIKACIVLKLESNYTRQATL